ncbi:QRFP-like peptide receptor [Ptychodera flava]|uniref:QRFP-like peptide receptor n=1 Tax=Ptychodera flava TaxID=63121 RepID=UPI00396A5F52
MDSSHQEDISRLLCILCNICPNVTAFSDYSFTSYDSYDWAFYLNYSQYFAADQIEQDEIFIEKYCPQVYSDNAVGPVARVIIGVVFSITVFLSVTGNTLAITILAFGNRVRTNFNTYLINLAVSDLVMAIMCMPFTTVSLVISRWPFGSAMCPIVVFMQQVAVTVSIYTLTAIAIDRYLAVVRPLRAKSTFMRPAVINATVWFVSMLLGMVQLFKAKAQAYPMESGDVHYLCSEVWTNRKERIVYELFIILIAYIGPLAVISYSYFAVVKILWMRQLPGNPDKLRDHRHAKSKRKVAKMAVVVVILFALCWLPLHTLMFWTIFYADDITESPEKYHLVLTIYFCFHWLAMANSFINPFIYTIYHEGFRTDLRNLCTLCQRSGRQLLSRINSSALMEGTLTIRSKSTVITMEKSSRYTSGNQD